MQTRPGLGQRVSLRSLLPEAKFFGADDVSISRCVCDSRRVVPQCLFAALPGTRHDGHDFVDEAAARGCRAILAQRPIPETTLPVCVVPDVRSAFGQVSQSLAGNPSHGLRVIGITGTNGKTTTSCLMAGVLQAAGEKPALCGTLGSFDGNDVEDSRWTTPPADRLAAWLARSRDNGCTHAVMEVSSHALHQARVAGIRFDAACVTNVTRDHLDYHRSIRDYRLAKSKLFEHLSGDGFAVINADDAASVGYLRQLDGPALTVGVRSAAEIAATVVEQSVAEQTFLLTAGRDTIPVCTRMIGVHHVYNCLIAAAAGLVYGIDLPTVVRGLESVKHVPGRLERLECGQPFGVFVDYAHTPDALAGCLRVLRELTEGKLICVFGAGGDRDRKKRPLMGRAVELGADLPVLTSDNPRNEDPSAIIADVLRGFRSPVVAEPIPDRVEAIQWALSAAEPGDCVLIAGKGHEGYQIVGEQEIPLDDGEIARQWLYTVRPHAEVGGKS